MKLCVAGTRGYFGPAFYVAARIAIAQATKQFQLNTNIDEMISGMCPDSPDMIGVALAEEAGIPLKPFPAEWDKLDAPGAVIRRRKNGTAYNLLAGYQRNTQVAEYLAQHDSLVILLWDGNSGGTADFKAKCEQLGVRVFPFIPKFQEEGP